MTIIRRERPIGEAGRKARTARADARAFELAPLIAELRETGITSLRAIATESSRKGMPTATGVGERHSAKVRRMLAIVARPAGEVRPNLLGNVLDRTRPLVCIAAYEQEPPKSRAIRQSCEPARIARLRAVYQATHREPPLRSSTQFLVFKGGNCAEIDCFCRENRRK
jgi:hypothetical protein